MVIEEVNRIKNLMLISESAGPIPWYMKLGMALTDGSVDDIVKVARKKGLTITDQEVIQLKNSLDDIGDVAYRKSKSEGVPVNHPGTEGWKVYEKIYTKLKDSELLTAFNRRINEILSDPNGYYYKEYVRAKDTHLMNVDDLLNSGSKLTQDDIIGIFLRLFEGRFPEKDFKEYINWVKAQVKRDGEFEDALVAAGLKERTTPTTMKVLPKPGSMKGWEKAYWSYLEPWTRWFRKPVGMTIRSFNPEKYVDNIVKEFNDSLSQAYEQYRKLTVEQKMNPNTMKAEYRKLMEKYKDLAGRTGRKFDAGDVAGESTRERFYKSLWEDYTNVDQMIAEGFLKAEDKELMSTFLNKMTTLASDARTLTYEGLINNVDGGGFLRNVADEYFRKIQSKGASVKLIDKILAGFNAVLKSFLSNWFSGAWITPATFSNRMAKELEPWIKITNRGRIGNANKIRMLRDSNGFVVLANRGGVLNAWTIFARTFFFSYLVLPAICGIIAVVVEGSEVTLSGGKVGKYKLEEDETKWGLFGRIVMDTLFEGTGVGVADVSGLLLSKIDPIFKQLTITPTMKEWKTYTNIVGWIPGEDILDMQALIVRALEIMSAIGDNEKTQEEFTQEGNKMLEETEKKLKNYENYEELGMGNVEDILGIMDTCINVESSKPNEITQRVREYFKPNHAVIHFYKLNASNSGTDNATFYLEYPNGVKYHFYVDTYTYENSYAKGPDKRVYKFKSSQKDLDDLINALYNEGLSSPIEFTDISLMGSTNQTQTNSDTLKKTLKVTPVINKKIDEGRASQTGTILSITNKLIKEMNEGKKFGEDNFKHWKDTFKFKKYDEKTNQLKDVKITAKMDEIMDRIDHFRKKYDEDDSFVRAVIDVYGTGIDIIQYTKGLAHLTEGVIVGGLLGVLSTIRESKELVTWTVKHYKDGNWELVKGNFNKKELLNVGKTKRERDERQKESDNPADGLKKKEQESIMILSRDEKEGLNGLPTKVKQKVKEKLRQGWTTEKPFDFLNTYYSESEINSVFNDKIKIYKLKPSAEFFRSLSKNSSKVTVKKGFCKSVKNAKGEYDLSEREKNTLNHFISKCESKFGV
jgi:hypothetical protein